MRERERETEVGGTRERRREGEREIAQGGRERRWIYTWIMLIVK